MAGVSRAAWIAGGACLLTLCGLLLHLLTFSRMQHALELARAELTLLQQKQRKSGDDPPQSSREEVVKEEDNEEEVFFRPMSPDASCEQRFG